MNDPNIQDIFRIYASLQDDGSLERDDAIILLNLMMRATANIRPHIKKPLLNIALAGVQKILHETIEHMEEIDE